MKKDSKLKSLLSDAKTHSRRSALYILIAVVAIIECIVLISFTTYSWIETASSLIIKTGHKYLTDTVDTRIPISRPYNYKFIVGNSSASSSDSNLTDLNNYFSYSGESNTQNLYRFSRASSADGKTFFFPRKTNLNPSATTYRKGDIIDSNAEFAHFDFVVNNKGAAKTHKLKFYFSEQDVFTVTNDTSTLTDAQLATVKRAMRISFQVGNGTPKIYCPAQNDADEANTNEQSYSMSAVSAANGNTTGVSVTKIRANDGQKLFTIGKDSEQNISIRIWLEDKAAGLGGLTGEQLAGVNIAINLRLTYAENDYDFMYFDDYTFSSGLLNKGNIGGHLTEDFDESDSHRMFFVYQESSNGANRKVYPMTRDNSGSNADAICWVTCDASGTAASTVPDITSLPYITRLTDGTTSNSKNALKYSYFGYGNCSLSSYSSSNNGSNTLPSNITYKWYLNDIKASSDTELRYSAYSATSASEGAGGWTYNTPLSVVYFRDLATGVTTNNYNVGNNFKYISSAVRSNTDTESTGNRSNIMYAYASGASGAKYTATLYYDKSADNGNGIFKSWVPSDWLSSSKYINFCYCPGGSYANPAIVWNNQTATREVASKTISATDYVYTALGYSDNSEVTSGSNADGSGTWREIESQPVYFSTELIDNVVTSANRYQIGVKFNGCNTSSYYTLIPDETNMRFYAYIPKAGTNAAPASDYDTGTITFGSYQAVGDSDVASDWYCNARKGSNTYYPVAYNDTAGVQSAPKGYWNISVIVDGTYEHFFWDYKVVSDPSDDTVLGTFSYNTTGHAGDNPTYTDITPNKLDEYRWYVPLDGLSTIPENIYYKWEPYTNTVFKYSQRLSDGIYCVITEASDGTPSNAFN